MSQKTRPFVRHAMMGLSFLLAAQAGAEEMTDQERDILYGAIFASPPPQAMWWEATGGQPVSSAAQVEQESVREPYTIEQRQDEQIGGIKAMMGGVLSDAGARDFASRNLPRPVLNIPSEMLPKVAPAAYATVGAVIVTRAADRVLGGGDRQDGPQTTLRQEMVRAAGREVARQSVGMAADGARLAVGTGVKVAGRAIEKVGDR